MKEVNRSRISQRIYRLDPIQITGLSDGLADISSADMVISLYHTHRRPGALNAA
jgi:hypothetical protein